MKYFFILLLFASQTLFAQTAEPPTKTACQKPVAGQSAGTHLFTPFLPAIDAEKQATPAPFQVKPTALNSSGQADPQPVFGDKGKPAVLEKAGVEYLFTPKKIENTHQAARARAMDLLKTRGSEVSEAEIRATNPTVAIRGSGTASRSSSTGGTAQVIMADLRGTPGFAQTNLLVSCGAVDTLALLVYTNAATPLTNLTLDVNLPTGLEYGGFVFGGRPGSVINELNVGDPEAPVFEIPWLSQDSFQVYYIAVRANCQASPKVSEYLIEYKLSFDFGGMTCTETFTPEASFNNQVKLPVLNVLSVTPSSTVFYNLASIQYQYIDISQDGISAYVDSFVFKITNLDLSTGIEIAGIYNTAWGIMPYTYDAGSNVLTVKVGGANFLSNIDPLGRPVNQKFDVNERTIIRVGYKMPECHSTPLQKVNYLASYNCRGTECQEPSVGSGTLKQTPTFSPHLTATATLVQPGGYCGTNIIVDASVAGTVADPVMGKFTDLTLQMSNCDQDGIHIAGVSVGPAHTPLPSNCYGLVGGVVELYFENLAFDPDGAGVGIEDTDGDLKFDDLPGGNTLAVRLEFSMLCPTTINSCTSAGCDIYNITAKGRKDCGINVLQEIAAVTPHIQFNYGTTTSGNETTITGNVPGYDFGTVTNYAPYIQTKHVEICYQSNPVNLTTCATSTTHMEVKFSGVNHFVYDIQASNIVFDGTAATITWQNVDPGTRIMVINAGNSANNQNFCYSFDLTLDSCVCSPPQYVSMDAQVIEECTGGCTCKVLKGCKRSYLYASHTCTGCSCDIQPTAFVTRQTTGFTDKTMTTRWAPDAIPAADKSRFMPGDTAHVRVVYQIANAINVNKADMFLDLALQHRRIDYLEEGQGVEGLRFIPDTRGARIVKISVIPVSTGIPVVLTNYQSRNGDLGHQRGLWIYGPVAEDSVDMLPTVSKEQYYGLGSNSSTDKYDGISMGTLFRNWDIVDDYSVIGTAYETYKGDGLSGLKAAIGGTFTNGDQIVIEHEVPLVKNPVFIPAQEVAAVFYPYAYGYQWNTAIHNWSIVSNYCESPAPYQSWEPAISVQNKMVVDDCGAEIFNTFKISTPPAGWFSAEYRPVLGLEQFFTDIPDPLLFASGATYKDRLGTVRPLVVDSFGFDPVHSVYAGTDYYTTNVGAGQPKMRLYFRDAEFKNGVKAGYKYHTLDRKLVGGTYPLLGVGLNNDDSIQVHVPLFRLCAEPVDVSDLRVGFNYSNRHLYDFNGDPFLCNTHASAIYNRTPGCGAVVNVPYWPNFARGSSLNNHRSLGNTSTVYNIINNQNTYPVLTASLASGILNDIEGGSENNTFDLCAGAGSGTHLNVVASITVPNSIQLISVKNAANVAQTFTLVRATDSTKVFSVLLPNLSAFQCATLKLETEQLFCTSLPDDSKVCIAATSGCMPAAQAAAILGQLDPAPCAGASACYFYGVKEADIQAEWIIMPSGEVPLCANSTYGIRVKNVKPALLTNLKLKWLLPEGLNPIPGSWQISYPNGPVNQVGFASIPDPVRDPATDNVYGKSYRFLDDADFSVFLSNNGLLGVSSTTALTDSNQFVIKFMVATVCDTFVSGSTLCFRVDASGPCESTVTSGNVKALQLITQGANPANFAQILTIIDPPVINCGATNAPLMVTCLNTSVMGQTSMSIASLTLPAGMTLGTGGLEFLVPTGFVPAMVFDSVTPSGLTLLRFDVPDGIGPYEFFQVKIPVDIGDMPGCGQLDMGIDVRSYIPSVSCSTGGQCGVWVRNTVNATAPITIKPPLKLGEFHINSLCETDPDLMQLEYDFKLTNPGTAAYNNTVTVEIVQDLNGNQIADDFETAIGSDVKTVNVAVGATVSVSGNMSVPEAGSCPSILRIKYVTTCSCDAETKLVTGIEPDICSDLGEKYTLCPGEKLGFPKCGNLTYSLSPSNGGSISQTIDSVFVDLFPGKGLVTPIVLTISGTQAACPVTCATAIYRTEPFAIGPYPGQVVCETGCTRLNLGLPGSWENTVSILWSPSTYLDDPTIESPTVCNPASNINYSVVVTNLSASGCSATATYPVIINPTTINSTSVGPCYYTAPGVGFNDVSVNISWATPAIPGDSIELAIGSMKKFVHPHTATQPKTVIFTVPASGSTQNVLVNYTKNRSCQDVASFTLHPIPTLANAEVCVQSTTTMTGVGTPAPVDPYISSNPAIATINSSGLVTGLSAGTATVTFTNVFGCQVMASVIVHALPVLPNAVVCDKATVLMTGSGVPAAVNPYISLSPYYVSITNSGLATGVNPGLGTILYTDNHGCQDQADFITNPLPNVVIDGADVICANATTTFFMVNGGYTILWNTGETTASIVPTTAGTYTVTVHNSYGCSSIASKTLTINPVPTATVSGTNVVCSGQSTMFTATGGISYLWSNGATTATIPVSVAGNYSVTATDGNGCTAVAARVLTVNSLPVVVITEPNAPCAATNPTFTASGGGNYLWSTGANTPAITPSGPGIYSVTVTDDNGCTSAESLTVLPSPTAGITGSATFCVNSFTTLTASGGLSYLWSTTETSASINVSSPGLYSVTVTNSSNCTATASRVVTASPIPTPTIVDTDANGGPSLVCDGTTATFSVTGGTSYLWSNGATMPTIVVSQPGTYTVTVFDGNGCSGTASRILSVNPAPPVALSACVQSFCAGDAPTLASLVAVGTDLHWYDSRAIGASAMAMTTQLVNGRTYYVAQMVDGCESIVKIPVMVSVVTPLPGHVCIGGCSN